MTRAVVGMAVLLSSAALVRAETACTRPMLEAATESYIAAQTAGGFQNRQRRVVRKNLKVIYG